MHMIKNVDELSPLLEAEMCEVWRDAGRVINRRTCCLMGGTAIVAHLGQGGRTAAGGDRGLL